MYIIAKHPIASFIGREEKEAKIVHNVQKETKNKTKLAYSMYITVQGVFIRLGWVNTSKNVLELFG